MKRVAVLLGGVLLVLGMTLATIRAGAQPEVVTNDNLNQMIAKAKTPADHEAIAAYYDHEAANNQKMAELHRASETFIRKPQMCSTARRSSSPTRRPQAKTKHLLLGIAGWQKRPPDSEGLSPRARLECWYRHHCTREWRSGKRTLWRRFGADPGCV